MSGARPGAFLRAAATTWLTIGLAIAAALHFHNIFVTVFAIYIVATRQNLLGLMIHEQTHYLGLKGKYGDWIANLLVAYPLLAMSIEGYAKIHLRHHRYYFSQQDPDFLRKQGPEWTFPMAPGKLGLLLLSDVTGVSFIRFLLRPKAKEGGANTFNRRNPSPKWLKPAFLFTVAVILTLVGGWTSFLLFWMLPLVTILPAIVRWGAICEHAYGEEGASVEETSPIIMPTLLSKIFLPNMNFAMHPYHHFFPGVAFCNLPALHRVFEEAGLIHQPMLFSGQIAYLRFILTGSRDRAPSRAHDLPAATLGEEAATA